ncbi:sulfotransferase [Thermodesulfobacteriota bacterium]
MDKIKAFWFETRGHFLNTALHLNRLRWNGNVGWGPRFKNWEMLRDQQSLLQFNAHQWLKCVENIQKSWPDIPVDRKFELRYEDLLRDGEKMIRDILGFLNVEPYAEFFESMPKLKKNNFNKWQKEFSKEQMDEIDAILSPKLMELGYEID